MYRTLTCASRRLGYPTMLAVVSYAAVALATTGLAETMMRRSMAVRSSLLSKSSRSPKDSSRMMEIRTRTCPGCKCLWSWRV